VTSPGLASSRAKDDGAGHSENNERADTPNAPIRPRCDVVTMDHQIERESSDRETQDPVGSDQRVGQRAATPARIPFFVNRQGSEDTRAASYPNLLSLAPVFRIAP
jgi:hypothetical protein